jgi:hypothetical protein
MSCAGKLRKEIELRGGGAGQKAVDMKRGCLIAAGILLVLAAAALLGLRALVERWPDRTVDFRVLPGAITEVSAVPTDDAVRLLAALSGRRAVGLEHLPEGTVSLRAENKTYLEVCLLYAHVKKFVMGVTETEFRVVDRASITGMENEMVVGEVSPLDIPFFVAGDEPFGRGEDWRMSDQVLHFQEEITKRVPPGMPPVEVWLDSRAFLKEGGGSGNGLTGDNSARLYASDTGMDLERRGNTLLMRLPRWKYERPAPLAVEMAFKRQEARRFVVEGLTARQLLDVIAAFSGVPVEVKGALPKGIYQVRVEKGDWRRVREAAARELGAKSARMAGGRWVVEFAAPAPGPILEEVKLPLNGLAQFRVEKEGARLVDQLEQFRLVVAGARSDQAPPVFLVDTRLARVSASRPMEEPPSGKRLGGGAFAPPVVLAKYFADLHGLEMRREGVDTLVFLPGPNWGKPPPANAPGLEEFGSSYQSR